MGRLDVTSEWGNGVATVRKGKMVKGRGGSLDPNLEKWTRSCNADWSSLWSPERNGWERGEGQVKGQNDLSDNFHEGSGKTYFV